MIGGISANIACSPFFEEGNGSPDFYLFLRESVLGPDAIMGIVSCLMAIDPETEKILDTSGSDVVNELYQQLIITYVNEAMEGNFNKYPIVDVDLESSKIYAKMIDEFKIASLSGAMMSSYKAEDELDVTINAHRSVSAISNHREMIRMAVQLGILFYELRNFKVDKKDKNRINSMKQVLQEIGESICYPIPIRNWEYFNMTGMSETDNIKLVVSAMIGVILDSQNFEECVKKSGSCFHHASFISFNAGLIAELIFGVPEDIANDGYTILNKSPSLYDVVAEFEKEYPPNIVKKRSFMKRNF